MTCSEELCDRPSHARGLCKMHYNRAARAGLLSERQLSYAEGNDEAFWSRVSRSEGCWEWIGGHTSAGYGNLRLPGGASGYAHRVAYILTHGSIPEGKVLDHLCRNRGCVNPSHLEPVEQLENVRRGAVPYGVIRPTCRHGHDITNPTNVYVRPSGHKLCRACSAVQTRRYRSKKKELQ